MAKQDLGKIVPTFNGIYNANIVYEKLCIVNYKGSVYVSKKDIPKGTDISNEEYWYLLIEKLKKGVDYFTEEDRKAIIDEVTKLAESDFNKYYDEKKKALDKVASDNTAAFLKVVKDNTTDFNSNVDTQTKAFDTHYDEKVKSFDENSDEQTTAYDTNANKKLNDYNENHKSKMQELDNEATTKIAEYDQHSEELRNMAVSTDNELERVKNEILDAGSASDTFIHVEDSCMAKLKELEIEGVCEQETTKGNQLIDFTSIGSISCDVKFENDTLKITSNKSYSRASKNITELLRNNVGKVLNFTFGSINFSKTLGGRIQLNILKNDRTRLYQGLVETSSKKVSYTIPNDFSDITSITLEIYSNNTSEDSDTELTILKPLLYFGNNDSYEPYTGGQPSPSPEFPQEIKTITDSLKITSCGKNLFDINKTTYPKTSNGLTITTENGYFIINGTCTSAYANISNAINFVIPAGTYTISIDAPQNFKVILKRQFANGSSTDNEITAGLTSKTFTTNITSNRYYFFLGSLTPGMTIDNAKFKIQFERKDNAIPIENYIESQIQAKLPEGEFIGKFDATHKDTLRAEYFPEERQYHWMLDKVVGMGDTSKYFGNVNRIITKQNNSRFTFDINTDKIPNSNTEPGVTYPLYCNKFIKGSRASTYSEINSISYGTSTQPYSQFVLYYSEIKGFTIAQFSDWLRNNPLIIYYILQKPYTIDLGPIDMPLSYKGITNIFTDSDLLPKITAKYYRTFEKTIQNMQINEKSLKQEITDLNNNISDITKRLEALESANVSTVEESEASNDLQN